MQLQVIATVRVEGVDALVEPYVGPVSPKPTELDVVAPLLFCRHNDVALRIDYHAFCGSTCDIGPGYPLFFQTGEALDS